MPNLTPQLAALLAAVQDPAQPKSSYGDVEPLFANVLGRPPTDVYAARVSKPGNLSVRADQSMRAQTAKVFVAVLPSAADVDRVVRAMAKRIGPGRYLGGVVLAPSGGGWSITVAEPQGGTLFQQLHTSFPGATRAEVEAEFTGAGLTSPAPLPAPLIPQVAAPLVLDPRVKRMLRLSIASAKAIMVVGPPGTGKTTLLDEALREIEADPDLYGLAAAPSGVRQVTPEEAWTTRDLLGGETVDDQGRLRFRPGYVLEAIRDNEWLFLDEANRADMDKIFGGLLTWLSNKPVVLGRAAPGLAAPSVRLEWGTESPCMVDGYERLAEGSGDTPIRFIAGSDWRLIGTYNALDAQRVFRFGQALGRRFARVPVPPITVEEFGRALQPHLEELPPEADGAEMTRVLTGLYAAHVRTAPPLGPALFLAVPGYVARGLGLLDPSEFAQAGATASAGDEGDAWTRLAVADLVAEGYLLGAGTWLAQLGEDELASFRRRVVDEENLLSEAQWTFIQQLLPALA